MSSSGMGAQKPEAGKRTTEFSLYGGPLHRLGCRLHLVRGGTNPIPLGIALGGITWLVVLGLTLIEGLGPRVFSLTLIALHVRLLVVIPLFFVCEAWVYPQMTVFVSDLVRSGVVPEKALPALEEEIARHDGRKNSWAAEAICLLAAVLLTFLGPQFLLTSGMLPGNRALASGTLAGLWYWIFCLTLFRFLLFRWFWRLGLWWYFLRRLAKLELHLVPTHPDGAAGLGYLEVVHAHFMPLVVAFSTIQSAALAELIVTGSIAFEIMYPALVIILLLDAALFLGPLLVFTPKLWGCWAKGLRDYMRFADQYVRAFDKKWLGSDAPPAEPLMGTPDLQSLADLSNSVNVIRTMSRVPASFRLLRDILITALLPLLPLFLLKYPIADLAQKLFA